MSSMPVFLLVISTAAVLSIGSSLCTSNSECRLESCCVLEVGISGPKLPTCKPYKQKGALCWKDSLAISTTLVYPDRPPLEVVNIHTISCPCADGLSCENVICI